MKRRYFLGVDGGGSKTIAVVIDERGIKIGSSFSGSVDILNVSPQEFKENLFGAVEKALSRGGISLQDVSSACFGIPALGDVNGIENQIRPIVDELQLNSYILVNDVRVALEGALPEKAGAVILAGTGAMAMAKDKNGNIFRVDGWGEHIGDLGSGYFIGRMALQRVFEEYDERKEKTDFFDEIKKYAKVSDIKEILINCKGKNVRKYIASFSTATCDAARKEIKPACEILDIAAKELFKTTKTIVKKINSRKTFIALAGGVFNCTYVRENFKKLIAQQLPNVEISKRSFEPHIGAAIMAAKRILNSKEMEDFYKGLKAGGNGI